MNPFPRHYSTLLLLSIFLYISPVPFVAGLGTSVSHSIPYGTEECMTIRVPAEPHIVRWAFCICLPCSVVGVLFILMSKSLQF